MSLSSQGNSSRRVLLPIDGSEHCKRAVHWYLTDFYRTGDKVYFVHIAEPHFSRTSIDLSASGKDVTKELNKTVEKNVDFNKVLGENLQQQLKQQGIDVTYFTLVGTKPGEIIVSTARDKSVDVVIIGNRGVSAIRRTFLGSVSDYVLHHANIPVIVVPPNAA